MSASLPGEPAYERRELLARYMFEQTPEWRWLASAEDADWSEWIDRNQDQWRAAAADLLAFVDRLPR